MDKKQHEELNRNRTIPIFDCDYERFDEHIEFYTALGFKIIYYQKAPYRFASVKMEGIGEIGFYGAKKDRSIGGCCIIVPNVREVHQQFKANLKSYYGKIPSKGFPKISSLNQTAEDWRFNIKDLNQNMVIVEEMLGDSQELMDAEEERVKSLKSKFEKSYASAYRFAHSKQDFLAARNILEVAFNKLNEELPAELLFKAKVLKVEVFSMLNQKEEAENVLKEIEEIQLAEDEKENLDEFLQRLDELKSGV